MKKRSIGVLLLVLLCAGCTEVPESVEPETTREAQHLAQIQLGELDALVNETERARVEGLLGRVIPLRQARLETDTWEKSGEEARLVEQLNRLYERYTVKYIGNGGTWGYGAPVERILAEYNIRSGEQLWSDSRTERDESQFTEEEFQTLWKKMRDFLPEGAWADFSRLIVFTDGVDETLAYVYRTDDTGDRWAVAVDPADAADWDWFAETVLHEYAHYLTLNSEQVCYTDHQTASTYNEEGMVAEPGSYLDLFYQTFWADYLDDRLANLDSFNFFLRHEPDFISAYASTDPSEDIAESFTGFILLDRPEAVAVWEEKVEFFYQFPELVAFRTETRARLELGKEGTEYE